MTRIDAAMGGAALAVAVGLIVFGICVHPVPGDHTPECDGYLQFASKIRAGVLPQDRFRPLLYPASVAALSHLIGDVFSAARIVSSLAGAALVWFTFCIGRQLSSRGVGLAAAAMLVVNPIFVKHGVLASTDMLFAALAAATLHAVLCFAGGDRRLRVCLMMGTAAGLAWSTRYVGAALVVPIALALWGSHRWMLRGMVTLFAAAAAATPQMLANVKNFGSPLYSEQWRSLAVKLDGRSDWSILSEANTSIGGWWDVISASPGVLVTFAYEQMCVVVRDTIPTLLAPAPIGFALSVALLTALVLVVLPIRNTNRSTRRRALGILRLLCPWRLRGVLRTTTVDAAALAAVLRARL